jgi:hypothetical protein
MTMVSGGHVAQLDTPADVAAVLVPWSHSVLAQTG